MNTDPQTLFDTSRCFSCYGAGTSDLLVLGLLVQIADIISPTPPPVENHLLADLASYWKLDENAGQTRVDSIGSNDLTDLLGSISTGAGIISQAAACVNSNGGDGLYNGGLTGLDATGDFSFNIWVNIIDTANNLRPFQIVDSGNSADAIFANMTAGFLFVGTDNGSIPIVFTPGTFFMLTISNDFNNAGFMNIYKDGVFAGFVFAQSLDITNGFVQLFNLVGAGDSMRGRQCQSGWWNRALSQAEITILYNSGAGFPLSSFMP